MARSTSWVGISLSEPSTFSNFPSIISTSWRRSAVTLPSSSPRKHSVFTA